MEKKPPAPGLVVGDAFPADETPTPTRILRMADMDLFGELKVLKEAALVSLSPSKVQHPTAACRTLGSTVAGRTHSTCTSGRLQRL